MLQSKCQSCSDLGATEPCHLIKYVQTRKSSHSKVNRRPRRSDVGDCFNVLIPRADRLSKSAFNFAF